MIRYWPASRDIVFGFDVIDFPFTTFVTERYTSILLFVEFTMLGNPRNDLFLERFAYTQRTGIDNTPDIVVQCQIDEPFPLGLMILFDHNDLFGVFGDKMEHLSISPFDSRRLARLPGKLIWIEPTVVFCTWETNWVLNVSQVPCRGAYRLLILSEICWKDAPNQPKCNGSSIEPEAFE